MGAHFTITIIRNPQNSIGTYLGHYFRVGFRVLGILVYGLGSKFLAPQPLAGISGFWLKLRFRWVQDSEIQSSGCCVQGMGVML